MIDKTAIFTSFYASNWPVVHTSWARAASYLIAFLLAFTASLNPA
jgi:hypothetical protein